MDRKYKCVKFYVTDNETDHVEKILNYESPSGYHYCGWVPNDMASSGKLYSIMLIFEKDKD